jgi:hypothetical protein
VIPTESLQDNRRAYLGLVGASAAWGSDSDGIISPGVAVANSCSSWAREFAEHFLLRPGREPGVASLGPRACGAWVIGPETLYWVDVSGLASVLAG